MKFEGTDEVILSMIHYIPPCLPYDTPLSISHFSRDLVTSPYLVTRLDSVTRPDQVTKLAIVVSHDRLGYNCNCLLWPGYVRRALYTTYIADYRQAMSRVCYETLTYSPFQTFFAPKVSKISVTYAFNSYH